MILETKHLHPEFSARVAMIIEWIDKTYGVKFVICSSIRSFAEQNALYARGRSRRGKRVTNAKGGESYHNYGLAVDLCLETPVREQGKLTQYPNNSKVWDYIGEAAVKFGLTWGGNWKSIKDRPHLEVPVKLDDIKASYKNEGIEGVFALVSDRFSAEAS